MRLLRCFLYLIVGLLLGAKITLSYADYAASEQWCAEAGSANQVCASTPLAACSNYFGAQPPDWRGTLYGCNPKSQTATQAVFDVFYQSTTYWNYSVTKSAGGYCPNGGTLSGSTCIKTCPEGQVQKPDGTCEAPPSPCAGKDQQAPTYAWVSFNKGNSPYGQRCNSGCVVYQTGPVSHPTLNPNGDSYVGGTHDRHELMKTQYTATQCTVGQDGAVAPEPTVAPEKAPPPVPKKPLCGATEGVLTTSSGTVACVPEGTVEARKPGITQEKKTETYQDGSKKETTTTTTQDPATNAKDTTVSTTITAGPSGGTMAGAPGTSSSNGTTTSSNGSNGAGGSGEGGDGDCDPTLNFCGGPDSKGTYTKKDKTLGDAFSKFSTGFSESGLGQAMTGFFTVNVASGACPSWIVNSEYLNWSMDLGPFFCNATALQAFTIFGNVLLLVVTFLAFRWAIL